MILLIYNTKPTSLHYPIVLFVIPIKQAIEFVYNTSITSKGCVLKCTFTF